MADYYSILKKTVSGLPNNSADTRKLVYAKARATIDKQLRSINPPPSEQQVAAQMDSLEVAIQRLEREISVSAPPPASPKAAPPDAAPARPAAGPPPSGPPSAPQPPQAAPPPSAGIPTARPGAFARNEPAAAPTGATPARIPPQAGPEPARAWTPPRPQTAPPRPHTMPPRAAPAAPRPGAAQPAGQALPRSAGEAPPSRPRSEPPAATLDETEPPRKAGPPEEPRGSRLAAVIVILLLLGIVGGGGYAIWRNKDALMELTGIGPQLFGGDTPAETGPVATEEPAPASEAPKEDARLNEDGQTTVPEPADGSAENVEGVAPVQDNAVRTVESEPQAASPVEESGTASGDEPTPGAPLDDEPNFTAPESQPGPEATNEQPIAVPAIGQKAYLYEEGLGNAAATRDNAAIIWSLGEAAPAEGLQPEAVIKGQLEVPGRGLTMELTIRRNVDEALSASHIIELSFKAPPDFSGGSIDTLARFVMKSSEQARGEPLVAVPVKISDGYFMIALNNLEQARESNKRLLLESSWIDIPLGYTTGRRALVTLEKGAIGDQVFRDAFADWDNR